MTRRLSPAGRAATAHHEAGHAVAALMRHIRFSYVTIQPNADSVGHLLLRRLRPVRAMEPMHNRGIVALAGEVAQRRFNPRSVRRHQGVGDREQVAEYAIRCSGSPEIADALVRLWQLQAAALVKRFWPSIERIAAALLAGETLDEEGCRRLVFPQPGASP